MTLISTFAALSSRGFGAGLSNPVFGGTGFIGYQNRSIIDAAKDSSGNNIFLLSDGGIISVTQYGALNFYKTIEVLISFMGSSFPQSFLGICLHVDSSNNILVGGQSGNLPYMAKFDSNGIFVWGKSYTTSDFGDLVASINTNSAYVYVGSNQPNGAINGRIVGHYSDGTNGYSSALIGTTAVCAIKILFDNSNNKYITYRIGISSLSPADYRRLGYGVACIDSTNTVVYTYNLVRNAAPRYSNYVEDTVVEPSTQNLYILQRSSNQPVSGTINAVVVTVTKLSSTGSVLWTREKSIPATTSVLVTGSITLDPTGNVYITFALTSTNQTYLVKFDSSGNTLWYNEVDINANTVYTPPYGLKWFNNRITLSGGSDIENFPDSGLIPRSGAYINSSRTYHYYPTFNTSFTSATVTTSAFSLSLTSAPLQGTAATFRSTAVTNAYSLVQIGA